MVNVSVIVSFRKIFIFHALRVITRADVAFNFTGYDGNVRRGRLKTLWMSCVKEDILDVSAEMTHDRFGWKNKTFCAEPT